MRVLDCILTLAFFLSPCSRFFSPGKIDEGVYLAFAGISADGRVLASKIRLECQSYRYSMGAAPNVGYIARYVGGSYRYATAVARFDILRCGVCLCRSGNVKLTEDFFMCARPRVQQLLACFAAAAFFPSHTSLAISLNSIFWSTHGAVIINHTTLLSSWHPLL